MSSFKLSLLLAVGLFTSAAVAQMSTEPVRDTALVEVKADQVPTEGISEKGKIALQILPNKWKVAETPHFYVHFRRMTEARKVAREIEFNLGIIAQQLGAKPEQYAAKSHVYVFEDAGEWADFISKVEMPAWTASFAYGDELFLNVRGQDGGPFDSQTLAHETTHAIISRIYERRRWPLWLNEGFSEYMGSAAVAARKNQTLKRFQNKLKIADMPLAELVKLQAYPTDPADVGRLYQTGEKFVRFLMAKGTGPQFVAFVDALIAGQTIEQAIAANYQNVFPTFEKFETEFNKYSGTRG
ncbi:MAG TPA: hypothetical protein VF585_02270 [Chthoniobacterales bacterium]|jgi:hypothetical protein